jgi:hypothetical protein
MWWIAGQPIRENGGRRKLSRRFLRERCQKFEQQLPPMRKQDYLGEMLNPADQRRRWFGLFFLIVAGGMLLWGLTFLNGPLMRNPPLFVIYWFACFFFATLAFCTAAYDMRVIRRRTRDEQRKMFEKAFSDLPPDAPQNEAEAGPERGS